MTLRYFLTTILCITSSFIYSQNNPDIRDVKKAIDADDFNSADSVLQAHVAYYLGTKTYDSLPYYVEYAGKIKLKISGVPAAVQVVSDLTNRIQSLSTNVLTHSFAFDYAADFLSSIGKHEMAYKYGTLAYEACKKVREQHKERLAGLEGDLGTYAMRMGNISASQAHNRNAVNAFLALPNPDTERLYMSANHMAGSMYMASKLDSAVFYYDIALKALSKAEKTPHNQFFRPAILQNNMAGLFGIQGKTTAAIDAMKSTIELLAKYLALKGDLPKRDEAIEFQFEATDNLAGIYRELGDYTRALDMLQYSYQQKIRNTKTDSSGIYKSQILIGQVHTLMKDYKKGEEMLLSGLKNISSLDGDYLFWQGDACNSLATLYEAQSKTELAERNYVMADSLYEKSMQGEYDEIYLEFLRNSSLFFAQHGKLKVAFAKANKGLDYVIKTQGTNTLLAFYQLLNLGQVSYAARDYKSALEYSNRGLSTIRKMVREAQTPLDSIKRELHIPRAILLNVKSRYELTPERSVELLKAFLTDLNGAVDMLDKRKSIIQGSDDIALLVSDHGDLLEFIKQINLELFRKTGDVGFVDRLIGLHESGIYMRIRSRLDRSDSMRFAHIPAEVPATEKRIKERIRNSLTGGSHDASMNNYFRAIDEWQKFQETVRQKYPAYYEMRYATLFKPMDDIQSRIPENTTLIRYFFIEKDLFAMVINKTTRNFVALSSNDLANRINSVLSFSSDVNQTSAVLQQLYDQLWKPLSPHVKGRKVVIVPDGILYNLSFELLTPGRINNYSDLATGSLLSKHAISYHYSLFLVGQKDKEQSKMGNFIAFAPGFLDDSKSRYVSTVKDSLMLDRSYLNLLPQPFSIDFAARTKRLLAGKAFVNDASTTSSFRSNAGGNKIIHIGTHAESNNIAPEFSRLIFSKSNSGNEEDNSIYLHEIYNCNLSSELAVLTACESGRPGFQDGEGMISLAHAFNYAGSESILTGLWSIDEKSSTMLMDLFYDNLLNGMDKDEALRLAKIEYLQEAKGRMLAPQYWAGLVLMGDTAPVHIKTKGNLRLWLIVGAGVLFAFGAVMYWKRRRRNV